MSPPSPTPRERTLRFLAESKVSQAELAHEAGVHQTTVSKCLRGVRPMSLQLAAAIERRTAGWEEGPIRAAEWIETEVHAATGTDG